MTRLGKFSRTIGRTVEQQTSFGSGFEPQEEPLDVLNSGSLVGGMNSLLPKADIALNEFVDLKGFWCRNGRLISIPVPANITGAKPNSIRILGYFTINRFSGSSDTLRLTKSSVHKGSPGSWTAITGAALGGGDFDRFDVVFVEDQIFFNNNGADVLQKADLSANTYAAAGNARRYKYYVHNNNRIIGANLAGPSKDPTEIAGSGDRNYSQWDPATDISSFKTQLVDPQGRSIDDITGIKSISTGILILRSRSLWIGTPQPIASTPYVFRKIHPFIGCNAPYSVQNVRGGVVWYDPFLANVFFFSSENNTVVPIGDKIKLTLQAVIGDVGNIFSSFDPTNNEYELGVEVPATGFSKIFVFNFDSNAWSYHELAAACTISNNIAQVPSTTTDSLGSTSINSLVGTIDSLSSISIRIEKLFCLSNGDIYSYSQPLSLSASGLLESKIFQIPGLKQNIRGVELDIFLEGNAQYTFTLYEGGVLRYQKQNASLLSSTKIQTLKFPVNKLCSEGRFIVSFGSYRLSILGYRILRYPSGQL